MRWRKTHDLDLSVSVSAEEYSSNLKRLNGWTPDPNLSSTLKDNADQHMAISKDFEVRALSS
jgi:hypothetical protein